jgi:uncharacterized protein (TIGR02646 family)
MLKLTRPNTPKSLGKKGRHLTEKLCSTYDSAGPQRQGHQDFGFRQDIYAAADVRQALATAQRDKCAYCETKQGPFEVEHYRPKSAVQQRRGARIERPGYYWLAYDWTNLLLVCVQCNQHRRDLRGKPTGKGILFPLENPKERARSHHDRLDAEKPLLINPYRDDPAQHITFHGYKATGLSRRGKTTVRLLLSGTTSNRRRDHYDRLLSLQKLLEGTPAPYIREMILCEFERLSCADQEFAAMVRTVVSSWRLAARQPTQSSAPTKRRSTKKNTPPSLPPASTPTVDERPR